MEKLCTSLGRAFSRPARLVFAGLVVVMLCAQSAWAIPTLQEYSPDATYDTAGEFWITYDNPLELWLVGTRTPQGIDRIDNLTLAVAILGDFSKDAYLQSLNPTLTITAITSTDPVALGNPDKNPLAAWSLTLDFDDIYPEGEPPVLEPFNGSNVPWHGVYPAPYWLIDFAGLTFDPTSGYEHAGESPVFLDVDDDGEDSYNFGEDFDPNDPAASGIDQFGDIQYYLISYSPCTPEFALQFDLIGYAHNGWDKWKFAPFSHTARAASPEPGTLLLILAGLGGLGAARLRKRRAAAH